MPDLGLDVLFKGRNAVRLLLGLGVALKISLLAAAVSVPAGIVLGMMMTRPSRVCRAVLRAYLEVVRIMPQLVLLFLVYFGTTRVWGWNLSGEASSLAVFSFWGTAETYLIENYPNIPLQKYDTYANAKNALENGNGAAWANDNTEVIAFALQNKGYTVGIPSLGSRDTIAPAVSKGNTTVLNWLNEEIESLGKENFFHADYEATLVETYGKDYENSLVVEGGKAE